MDPSVTAIRRQGTKASESTTDVIGERFQLRKIAARAHPEGWAAHLYCIGDGTLTRKQCGESGAAIAKMKRFGVRQK